VELTEAHAASQLQQPPGTLRTCPQTTQQQANSNVFAPAASPEARVAAAGPEARTIAEQAASQRVGWRGALVRSSVCSVARICPAIAATFSASSAVKSAPSTPCQYSASGSLQQKQEAGST
jgi:hypothetical protein